MEERERKCVIAARGQRGVLNVTAENLAREAEGTDEDW